MYSQEVRAWKPHRYQSDISRTPVDQWAPGYDDTLPNGAADVAINMDDIGKPYSLAECRAECVRRNTLQVHNARRQVELLEEQLAAAREHLTAVEYALGRGRAG